VQKDPQFAPLMSSIDKILVYGHYDLPVEPRSFLDALSHAPVAEIAAYGVRDTGAHHAVHARVHEVLRSHQGYRAGAPGQQREDASQFLDLIVWDSAQAKERAGAALPAVPELAGFFGGIAEMKVFELFTPVR
jgi:hypothetical protein